MKEVKTIPQESIQKENAAQSLVTEETTTSGGKPGSADRGEIWKMFDRIALRYDLLNRSLSFGQDVIWRKKVVQHLKDTPNQSILDLATGTADLLITVYQKSRQIGSGIGIDLAEKIYRQAGELKKAKNMQDRLMKIAADDDRSIRAMLN